MVGLLHKNNHFITIYISSSYWTISDPLSDSSHNIYNVHLWETNLHSALRHIHSSLCLHTVDLPRYLTLPAPSPRNMTPLGPRGPAAHTQ